MLASLLNRHAFTEAAKASPMGEVHDFLTHELWLADPMGLRGFFCPPNEYAPESALILYALVHGCQEAASLDVPSGLVHFFQSSLALPPTVTPTAFAAAYDLSFRVMFSLSEGAVGPAPDGLFPDFLALCLRI
jgi:hypothetical protein